MAFESTLMEELRREDPPAEVPTAWVPFVEAKVGPSREEPSAITEPKGEAIPEVRVGTPPMVEVKDDVLSATQPMSKEGGTPPTGEPRSQLSRVTMMNRGRLTEHVLRRSSLAGFEVELRRLPIADALDTLFTAALQMSNGLFVLWDVCTGTAKTWEDALDKELAKVQVREKKVANDLRAAQEGSRFLKAQAEAADSKARAVKAKLVDAMTKLRPTEKMLEDALIKLEHAEERADKAESKARAAMEKHALIEVDAWTFWEKKTAAETQAQEAMEKLAATEAKAREAVEQYKGSTDFAVELSEAAMNAFSHGFERRKERISRIFKISGLECLRPED